MEVQIELIEVYKAFQEHRELSSKELIEKFGEDVYKVLAKLIDKDLITVDPSKNSIWSLK